MAFHNIPPNGFPDLPDMEELEAVVKDVNSLKTSVSGLTTDVSNLSDNKANQITIAPFFDPETSYEVGDLVYYNGLSYRCTNDHDGEWDADDFAATTIAGELDTLKSGLTHLDSKYITTITNTVENVAVGSVEYGSKELTIAGLYLINATIETNNTGERILYLTTESDSVGVVFYGGNRIKAKCEYGGILGLSVMAYIPANSTIRFMGYAYTAGDNLTVKASLCRLSKEVQ